MNRLPPPPMPNWLERMVPFQRYCVHVGGRLMHVMESGQGLPVLLLHGNPSWGFIYRRVVEKLSDSPLRLIMPDLIGLGFSDKPRDMGQHQLDNHIAWLARFIEQLELHRCVVAVQDWGGPIGIGALAQQQNLEAGLVLMNTALSPPRHGYKRTAFHRFANLPLLSDLAFRLGEFPQRMLGLAQGDKTSIGGEVAKAYRYPLERVRDNNAPLALARMVPDSPDHPSIAGLRQCEEYIETFNGPAAIVWGDRDPILGRLRRRTERMFPQAAVTRTSAGHFLQEEVPDEIAAAIRSVATQLQASES